MFTSRKRPLRRNEGGCSVVGSMFDIDVSSYFGAPDPRTRQAAERRLVEANEQKRGNHELEFSL